ncbi:MAG TPA: LysM peptidoglycan-binding domain-containing protein [Nitrospirota bacterium]|nr:LysM peptidoglycan-binding domain-containing protein [Nitrospirota bacterium]
MTSSPFALIRRALIVLIVALMPALAFSQDQAQPGSAPSPEQKQIGVERPAAGEELTSKPSDTAAPKQEAGAVVIPAQAGKTEAPQETTTTPGAGEKAYTIKRGDTLWDISNTFLKDPYLWPFLWKANPSIQNADLIYPGNTLTIPGIAPIERAMQSPSAAVQEQLGEQPAPAAPSPAETPAVVKPSQAKAAEQAPAEEAQMSRLVLPEEEQLPLVDKYSMLNAGFVNQEEDRGRIVGSEEGKTIYGYDDLVLISIASKEPAAVGDRFLIFRPLEQVKHPVTGRKFGRLIKVLGILQVVSKEKGEFYTGRITLSFDYADKGSRLTPYQEPVLLYERTAPAKTKDLSGYILEVVDGRTISAETDIVYLDKGSADGVEPGDRFLVYSRPLQKNFPRSVIGEALVFLVKEHTATAVVRKSTDVMVKGDPVEFKK